MALGRGKRLRVKAENEILDWPFGARVIDNGPAKVKDDLKEAFDQKK